MTNEQEAAFLKCPNLGDDELFVAGWDAALADRQAEGSFIVNQVKAERTILRDKIMDKAIAAFREGHDEAARLYRELALELFPTAFEKMVEAHADSCPQGAK